MFCNKRTQQFPHLHLQNIIRANWWVKAAFETAPACKLIKITFIETNAHHWLTCVAPCNLLVNSCSSSFSFSIFCSYWAVHSASASGSSANAVASSSLVGGNALRSRSLSASISYPESVQLTTESSEDDIAKYGSIIASGDQNLARELLLRLPHHAKVRKIAWRCFACRNFGSWIYVISHDSPGTRSRSHVARYWTKLSSNSTGHGKSRI